MSYLVHPKSRISSKILIFVRISSCYWKVFNLQTDKYILISKSVKRSAALLYITVDLFHWTVRVLLMSAVMLYCATACLETREIFCPKCYFSFIQSDELRPKSRQNF